MSHESLPTSFPTASLDQDALAIIERLQSEGHVSYFVGGCVRDLLLGREPKDYDLATEARPEELKKIFGRRCRIIGRRFKLAHIHAGSKVFEVATFRGLPDDQEAADDDSGFVVRANTFGSPEQDARSRDFTVNGLFYDPVAREILDWVGGRADVERRAMRTIGHAETRLREDPVRILRAVKLAARLDFEIDPDIVEASPEVAPLIATCPSARVSEEIFRISESGHAHRSFELMSELGVLESLLPEVAPLLAPDAPTRPWIFQWLEQLDRQTRAHGTLPRPATFTMLAWPYIWLALGDRDDPWSHEWGKLARRAIQPLATRLTVPVRHRQMLQATADLMQRLTSPKRRRPSRGQLRSRALPLALTLERTRWLLGDGDAACYEAWAQDATQLGIWPAPFEPRPDEIEAPPQGRRSSKPRRRRRRRKPEGGGTDQG